MEQFHGTTILSVRRQTPEGVQVAIGGDGQVTLGNIVIKGTARKVRKLYHGKVLAGFGGATADAFTLFERFEPSWKTPGQPDRRDRADQGWHRPWQLRKLEAMLAVADATTSLIITGMAMFWSPSRASWPSAPAALCAFRSQGLAQQHRAVGRRWCAKSLAIAGELCIYTNMNHTIETL
jgi:ATP-dependent HslUV protease subunit HslV